MKRYFNLLIEFQGHNQCLKMPRDYGDLRLGQESAGALALSGVQREACREIQMQLKILHENPFIVKDEEMGPGQVGSLGSAQGGALSLLSGPLPQPLKFGSPTSPFIPMTPHFSPALLELVVPA